MVVLPCHTKATGILSVFLLALTQGCSDTSPGTDAQAPASGPPFTVTDATRCSDCAVELDTLAVLGDTADFASIRADATVGGCMVGEIANSGYVVSGVVGGGELLEFGKDGKAVRAIGRKGAGPGEYGANLRLIARPDTFFVLDISNGRMAVADHSGRFFTTFSLPVRVHSFARLESGHFVIHGRPVTSEDSGPLFRILDERGVQWAAFGSPSPQLGEKDQWVVSARSNGGFLAASMWDYVIYEGNAQGELNPYIVRRADWFPSGTTWDEEILVTEAPPPLIQHVREDPAGSVWVFAVVADENWSPDIPDAGSAQWFRDSFDTIVEVMDPRQRAVLATTRFDDWLAPVCGSDVVYSVVPHTSGDTRAIVLRPRLDS